MKLLAFAASNSHPSINQALVSYAAVRFAERHAPSAELMTLDLDDYEVPIYSKTREAEGGVPELARSLHATIGRADAVMVSFAEHNGSTTAAWKNLFDWMSRLDGPVWQQKPVVFLAATPGPRAGAGVLGGQATLAPHFGADLRGSAGIGRWSEAWDGHKLTQPEDLARLDEVLAKLAAPAS